MKRSGQNSVTCTVYHLIRPGIQTGKEVDHLLLGIIHISDKSLDQCLLIVTKLFYGRGHPLILQRKITVHTKIQIDGRTLRQLIQFASKLSIADPCILQKVLCIDGRKGSQNMLFQRLSPVSCIPLQLLSSGDHP